MALETFTFRFEADDLGTRYVGPVPTDQHIAEDGSRYHRDLASYRAVATTGRILCSAGGDPNDSALFNAFYDRHLNSVYFLWRVDGAAEYREVVGLALGNFGAGPNTVLLRTVGGPRWLTGTTEVLVGGSPVATTTIIDNGTNDVAVQWSGAGDATLNTEYLRPMFFTAAPEPLRHGGAETITAPKPKHWSVGLVEVGPGAYIAGSGVLA